MKIEQETIKIGDIPVAELAAKYGTPLYVYDEQKIRDNYRRAVATFRKYYPDFRMFYAVKCCNNPAIVNILRQEGAGADCASVNEILLAKSVGLTGEDIMFSGNFLSDEDLRQGIETGAVINLDDESLFPRLLKFGVPEVISFRVNPGYGKSNVGEYVTNAGPKAKFGIHPDKVTAAFRMAKEAGVKRFGVHMMTGSCITDADYFPFVTSLLMEIVGKTACSPAFICCDEAGRNRNEKQKSRRSLQGGNPCCCGKMPELCIDRHRKRRYGRSTGHSRRRRM